MKCKKSCLSIPTAVHDHPKDGLPLNFPVDMRYPRIWYINIIYICILWFLYVRDIFQKIYMYNIENLVFLVGNLCTSSDLPWKISPVESSWRFWGRAGHDLFDVALKEVDFRQQSPDLFLPRLESKFMETEPWLKWSLNGTYTRILMTNWNLWDVMGCIIIKVLLGWKRSPCPLPEHLAPSSWSAWCRQMFAANCSLLSDGR